MAKDEHLGGLFRCGMTMEAYSAAAGKIYPHRQMTSRKEPAIYLVAPQSQKTATYGKSNRISLWLNKLQEQ